MASALSTPAVEDYLKAIYALQTTGERVSTTKLAERLGVAPASASTMMKKLAAMRLVTRRPYRGVVLSAAGERVALEVVRHHRLVERFLAEVLGMPWDRVHEEAEKWEHVLSEEVEGRIDQVLGHPTTDPHGAPIPAANGAIARRESVPLPELEPGQSGVVAEVSDHDPELLRYLASLGLYPDSPVSVLAHAPFGGPLTVRLGNAEHAIGREAARHVSVVDVRAAPETVTRGESSG